MEGIKLTTHQWQKMLRFLRSRQDIYVGKPRECKRFLEALLWMARSGAQWRLLPKQYGNWNSVYKRFNRWTEKGVWKAMLEYFAQDADMESVLLDSTFVRAHPCAAGAEKGARKSRRSDVVRAALPANSTPA